MYPFLKKNMVIVCEVKYSMLMVFYPDFNGA